MADPQNKRQEKNWVVLNGPDSSNKWWKEMWLKNQNSQAGYQLNNAFCLIVLTTMCAQYQLIVNTYN